MVKDDVPPEWNSSVDQEEPELVHIKEEQEERCTSQEREQLNALEEADINRFLFTAIPGKRENKEEDHWASQLHQSQIEDREAEPTACSSATQINTEADGEDLGESKPARDLGMSSHLLPITDGMALDSSETDDWQEPLSDSESETENNDGCEEMCATALCVNAVKYVETTVSSNTGKKSFICFQCGKNFYHKGHYDTHMRFHTQEKPFACELRGKKFSVPRDLKRHMRVDTEEKPFACKLCGKGFATQGRLRRHMRVHTGEKPFSCELCDRGFTQQGHLKAHMKVHTRAVTMR